MAVSYRLHLARALAVLGLTLSAALLIADRTPGARACAFAAGCEAVTGSRLGRALGASLPVLGLLTFGAVLALSLLAGRAARLLRPLAALAGLGGLALLAVQLLLRHLCPFCVLVDTAGLGIALLAVPVRGVEELPATARRLWLAAGFLAPALGAILVLLGGRVANPPPPAQVVALWVPDRVTVVEVADFECPQCRRMHAVLTRFLQEEGDRVHFVRLTVPMPAHPHARPASRAFLCAAQQGKGPEMAEALFTAARLDAPACERLAASLGLSLGAYRACVADPGVDGRLDTDLAWVKGASPRGLPVVWVQDEMLFGVQPIEALRSALERAERRLGRRAP